MSDDGWKTEAQQVLDLTDAEQAQYHRLAGLIGFWTALSFAVPVALVGTYVALSKYMALKDYLPVQLRLPLTWMTVVWVALGALPVCIGGVLLMRRRMKQIIADNLAAREWS